MVKLTSSRNIVVKLTSSKIKNKIFKNVTNLKGTKHLIVQEQLPQEIIERKKRLWSKYKAAKERAKTDRTVRVSWSLDKLIINGVVHTYKDDVQIVSPEENYNAQEVTHTQQVVEQKSKFIGHAAKLSRNTPVSSVLATLASDANTSTADHTIYAYRYGNVEGCSDDGEHGAGLRLLKVLQSKQANNTFVAVTRWFGGQHLGPRRFELIETSAKDALDLLNNADPEDPTGIAVEASQDSNTSL